MGDLPLQADQALVGTGRTLCTRPGVTPALPGGPVRGCHVDRPAGREWVWKAVGVWWEGCLPGGGAITGGVCLPAFWAVPGKWGILSNSPGSPSDTRPTLGMRPAPAHQPGLAGWWVRRVREPNPNCPQSCEDKGGELALTGPAGQRLCLPSCPSPEGAGADNGGMSHQ